MAFVAVRSSSGVNPVQAAASARSWANATHWGDRNGMIASATMTSATAIPVSSEAARPPRSFTASS